MIHFVTPRVLLARRLAFLAANLLIYSILLWVFAAAIGWSWVNLVMIASFAIVAPWTVLGLCNAAIGLVILCAPRARAPAPTPPPVDTATAIVMTVRNEAPERALARLRIVQQSLDATGQGGGFAFFVLSDSADPAIIAREAAAIAAWSADPAVAGRLTYRRRADNTGFKAGNVMDFCRQWGAQFELMLLLDADSLMSGPAILRLAGIMQAHPNIGIVQGLVTGMPAASLFARVFQFGMRHGMRSYTVGQAWWTGDCGPYWGHNAIIRIAPFRDHCALPTLAGSPPFGGAILSHDQVEAVLMRRAGFEVRLQPLAGGSWEDNPPTILDYIRRDLRWCQGNLQYPRLFAMPGLRPVSRFQLVWASLMFVSVAAWTLMMLLLPLAAGHWRDLPSDRLTSLACTYIGFLLMHSFPKLAGYAHTAASRRRRARYGGLPRFTLGAAGELIFALLQSSITSVPVSALMVGLLVGKAGVWGGQVRDARAVAWAEAARAFWPQTMFGIALNAALLASFPVLVLWALPFTLGYSARDPVRGAHRAPLLGRLVRPSWSLRHPRRGRATLGTDRSRQG